jgi:hypothetical protein
LCGNIPNSKKREYFARLVATVGPEIGFPGRRYLPAVRETGSHEDLGRKATEVFVSQEQGNVQFELSKQTNSRQVKY